MPCLGGAGRHLSGQHVFGADLAAVVEFGKLLCREHLFQLGRRLAGLRGVRLVGDDGKPLAVGRGQLAYRVQREREGLDRADDDLLALRQRIGELLALGSRLRS